jgi:hypothetical protein
MNNGASAAELCGDEDESLALRTRRLIAGALPSHNAFSIERGHARSPRHGAGEEAQLIMLRTGIGLAILFWSLSAAAAEGEGQPPTETKHEDAASAAAEGRLSAFGIAPSLVAHAGGLALAGYDGAARSFRARGAAEGRILSPLSFRVEYDYGPATGALERVALGLHGSLLQQSRHGFDLGVVGLYQPREFRSEGNISLGIALARSFGPLALVLNTLVGSDSEGDDQSLEARFSALYRLRPYWVLGVDSRGRYNLSDDEKRAKTETVDWEMQSGVVTQFGVGPLLLSALLGPSVLQRSRFDRDVALDSSDVRVGLLAMAGAGGAF